jgi:hypothetical protein
MRGVTLQSRPNSAANRQQAQLCFERALEMDPQSVLAKLSVAEVQQLPRGVSFTPNNLSVRRLHQCFAQCHIRTFTAGEIVKA